MKKQSRIMTSKDFKYGIFVKNELLYELTKGQQQRTALLGQIVKVEGILGNENLAVRFLKDGETWESTTFGCNRKAVAPVDEKLWGYIHSIHSPQERVKLVNNREKCDKLARLGLDHTVGFSDTDDILLGQIKYMGPVKGMGKCIGIKLHKKKKDNKCDGSCAGIQYFNCMPGYGVFTTIDRIWPLASNPTSDETAVDDTRQQQQQQPAALQQHSDISDLDLCLERNVSSLMLNNNVHNNNNNYYKNDKRLANSRSSPPPYEDIVTVYGEYPRQQKATQQNHAKTQLTPQQKCTTMPAKHSSYFRNSHSLQNILDPALATAESLTSNNSNNDFDQNSVIQPDKTYLLLQNGKKLKNKSEMDLAEIIGGSWHGATDAKQLDRFSSAIKMVEKNEHSKVKNRDSNNTTSENGIVAASTLTRSSGVVGGGRNKSLNPLSHFYDGSNNTETVIRSGRSCFYEGVPSNGTSATGTTSGTLPKRNNSTGAGSTNNRSTTMVIIGNNGSSTCALEEDRDTTKRDFVGTLTNSKRKDNNRELNESSQSHHHPTSTFYRAHPGTETGSKTAGAPQKNGTSTAPAGTGPVALQNNNSSTTGSPPVPTTTTTTTTTSDPKTPKYVTPKPGTTDDLCVGTLVEVSNDISKEPLYGVVRWMGAPENNPDYVLVGVELDDEHTDLPLTLTDGAHNGVRYFRCAENRALFVPLEQCHKDSRFQDGVVTAAEAATPGGSNAASCPVHHGQSNNNHQGAVAAADKICDTVECPVIVGAVAPLCMPTEEDVEAVCGKFRGIQGHHNSCYLDVTLFSMFTYTAVFDSLLFRPKGPNDINDYDEVQRVLREEIVNPLRKNLFVSADHVMNLRRLLDRLSSVSGLTSEEKDPEEFLNSLLAQILKADPFLKLNSGQESFYYQLFVEKDADLSLPTVQQLFEQSFLTSNIKLKEVPSCLIIQMPRFGKNYKMYPRILPSQLLDVTDVIEGSPRQCIVCGKLARWECRECFDDCSNAGLESTAFCADCLRTAHKHERRSHHRPAPLEVSHDFAAMEDHCRPPRLFMELFAVVCIETSHYVAFVKCGVGHEAPWCFFDSMADRQGEKNGYNIPEMVACPDISRWLSDETICRQLHEDFPSDRHLPEHARRLLCDAYICMYQSSDVMMYR